MIMVSMTAADDELVDWLLEGDPSIRWRVHRDLLGSPVSTVRGRASQGRDGGLGRQADFAARPRRALGRRRLFAQVDLHDVHPPASGLAWASTATSRGLGRV